MLKRIETYMRRRDADDDKPMRQRDTVRVFVDGRYENMNIFAAAGLGLLDDSRIRRVGV